MNGMTVFMFPGQGSQYAGMGARLGPLSPAQRNLFNAAEEILGFGLLDFINRASDQELARTSNTQPAMLVMDLAWADRVTKAGCDARAVMGHSLGEYAALVYCGVLDSRDALRLVRTRGVLMEEAAAKTPGAMAAVIGVETSELESVAEGARRLGTLEITNFNAPGQVVISGLASAVAETVRVLKEMRRGRAIMLNVSAPFHSSLMRPVAEEFAEHVDPVEFRAPDRLFIGNVTGMPESDPREIKRRIVEQIYMPVQWELSVRNAVSSGGAFFVESGPGNVLANLVRRIDRSVNAVGAETLISGNP